MPGSPQPHLVVLLGAGASAPLKYPTPAELCAKTAVGRVLPSDDPQRAIVLEFSQRIDEFLRLDQSSTIESAIERAGFYIQMLKELPGDGNLARYLTPTASERANGVLLLALADKVRTLLYRSLHQIYGTPQAADESVRKRLRKFYSELAEQGNASGRLSVFTTNYDVALNAICGDTGAQRGDVSPEVPERLRWSDSPGRRCVLLVHRLHGCVQWFSDANGRIRRGFDSTAEWTRMVVKVGSGRDRLNQEPFKTAYQTFRKELGAKGAVCVSIGYGFRDPDVCRCIHGALVDERRLQGLVVVDKVLDCAAVADRLVSFPGAMSDKRLGERIKVCQLPVEDAKCGAEIREALKRIS